MHTLTKQGNGYKKVNISGSINDISLQLGYHPDQIHSYCANIDDPKIIIVALEVFSNNIVFILSSGETVDEIDEKYVEKYMSVFDFKDVYTSYTTENILKNGLENRSLKIEFLSKIFDIDEPEDSGMFYIQKLGMNLYFIDGVLTDFETSDGLTTWSKFWRDNYPVKFKLYESIARLFWGEDVPMIINEINKQTEAWAKIPDLKTNQFLSLHKTKYGTINYFMLYVCHYSKNISLQEFEVINHGRYKEVIPLINFSKVKTIKYDVDNFTYEFSENGNLIECSLK